MELRSLNESVATFGTQESGSFSIEMNEHMAELLSAHTYTDKVAAPIRELCSNARDAHRMNGNEAKPFFVHVPTVFEPHFAVRDYGPGLDRGQVMKLYTTYGASSKREGAGAKKQIGGFGIGSKSPFAYQGNGGTFTVTSWHGGFKTVYVCYKDVGCPKINVMHCVESDEPTGLEVSFDVDQKDIDLFRRKIAYCLQWFRDPVPEFSVEVKFPVLKPYFECEYGAALNKNDSATREVVGDNQYYAVVGPVGYRITAFPEMLELVKKKYRQTPVILLKFEIHEAEVAASREELSYTDETKASILSKLQQFVDAHVASANDLVNKPISLVEKVRTFQKDLSFAPFTITSFLPNAFDQISFSVDKDSNTPDEMKEFHKWTLELAMCDIKSPCGWSGARTISNQLGSKKISVTGNSYTTINGKGEYKPYCILINDDPKAKPGRFKHLFEKFSVVYVLPSQLFEAPRNVRFRKYLTGAYNPVGDAFVGNVKDFIAWCDGFDVFVMSELPVQASETPERRPPVPRDKKPEQTAEAYDVALGKVRNVPLSVLNSPDSHLLVFSATDRHFIKQKTGVQYRPEGYYNNDCGKWNCETVGYAQSKFIRETPIKNVYVINKGTWLRFNEKQKAKCYFAALEEHVAKDNSLLVALSVMRGIEARKVYDHNERKFFLMCLEEQYPAMEHCRSNAFFYHVLKDILDNRTDNRKSISEIADVKFSVLKNELDTMPLMKYISHYKESEVKELRELYRLKHSLESETTQKKAA